MVKLIAALLFLSGAAIAQTYVTPVVTRTETVQIKTQSRVTRVEIYADDPRAVRMVTRHAVEYEVSGSVKPSVQMQHERKLPANAADTVTVSGTTLTRAQLVAFAVKFAEKDRADDLPIGAGDQVSTTSVPSGRAVTLTVTADGSTPFVYSWSKNSALISGATNAALVFANVQPTHSGVYSATVSNGLGSAVSNAVRLTVTP